MKGRKLIAEIVMVLVVMTMMASLASAVGVSPARTELSYKQGTQEFTLRILNPGAAETDIEIVPKGELQDYISSDNKIIHFNKGESEKEITLKVSLPETLSLVPGIHRAEIIISGLVPEADTAQSRVMATTEVVSYLDIKVPYPYKYAEASLYVTESQPGKQLMFSIPVCNLGNTGISSASAKITVYDLDNNVVHSVSIPSSSVSKDSCVKLSALWSYNIKNGRYRAEASVLYDGKEIPLLSSFTIGQPYIRISSVRIDDFSLGETTAVTIGVRSEWNEKLAGAYAVVTVTDPKGVVRSQTKTFSVDLDPYASSELSTFWNTAGLERGIYNITAEVFFDKGQSSSTMQYDATGIRKEQPAFVRKIASDLEIMILFALLLALTIFMLSLRRSRGR